MEPSDTFSFTAKEELFLTELHAMEEALRIEKIDLENRITTAKAKKMDALRVLQIGQAKQKTIERDLQQLQEAPVQGCPQIPLLEFQLF